MSDYYNAISFAAAGVPGVLDWAQDDTHAVADLRKDRKLANIGTIG